MGKHRKHIEKEVMGNDSMAEANIVSENPVVADANPSSLDIHLDNLDDLRRAIIYSEIINRKY